MKGNRDKYDDLGKNESFCSFFKRHTNKERYGTYLTAYNHLRDFCNQNKIEITEIGDDEATEFCLYLKEEVCSSDSTDLAQETAETYVENLSLMFSWIVENTDYLDWEPFGDVLDEDHFHYDQRESKKREVPLADLQQHIRNISSPSLLVLILVMLKTGLRIGEVADLTYRDIHLDHPVMKFMPEPRKEISDLTDALYVDSSKEHSKPKSYREIPIDQELKLALSWYIKLSPPTEKTPQPLIVDLNNADGAYRGLKPVRLWEYFTDWAKSEGLWSEPHSVKNIHPHWCRHWFTTVLRANINDDDVLIGNTTDYVEGLRGDKGEDVINTYSHNWETLREDDDPTWRDIYEDAMPLLLNKPHNTEVEKQEAWNELEDKIPEFVMSD